MQKDTWLLLLRKKEVLPSIENLTVFLHDGFIRTLCLPTTICSTYGLTSPTMRYLCRKTYLVFQSLLQVSEHELVDFVNSRVSDLKQIRGGIVFRDSLPRNGGGKLLRGEVREWAREQGKLRE